MGLSLKKYCILVLSFFIFLYPVKAENQANCTPEEKGRLRELANVTNISYEFKQYTNSDGTSYKAYGLTINNFTSDFYVWNEEVGLYITSGNGNIGKAEGLMPNTTYQIPFYASNSNACNGYLILTKTVYLPPYNYYSEDPLCKGHENYELCKKYSPIRVTNYEDFVNRMQSYIKSLEQKNNNEPVVNNVEPITMWDRIGMFLIDNILYITLPIIIIGTIIIVIIEIKRRRSIL